MEAGLYAKGSWGHTHNIQLSWQLTISHNKTVLAKHCLLYTSSNNQGAQIVRINHILAEDSPEPNTGPNNEDEENDPRNYVARLWPEHVVRW